MVRVYIVNRDARCGADIDLSFDGFDALRIGEAVTMAGDPAATNSAAAPDRVLPRAVQRAEIQGQRATVTIAPISWTFLELQPAP